ncbi:carbon-nitrogen hydrolase family protein [Halobellus clavatus]|uniref:(R)-amidase n=1 Tax=Halobellus clavatus TaxID=660517 RepID=A0A1H3EQH9_9EURY|nr:carbon-nitrogen hydrolase family protein [Halobellus clavatus]SDX80199.1 (R)-amidase [Halobellus clavatus]
MAPSVAACQIDIATLDVESNLATVERRVRGLPDAVEVAVFPEYALTGFVADGRIDDVALARDGATVERLRRLAATEDTALVVGFVEREGDSLYNTAAYVDPDGGTTGYRKRHLWEGERDVLEAGDDLVIVETPVGTAGLLTCYDLNFVGDSATLADERVDALFVLGAWPGAYSENWRLLLRARALDGVRWVVGAGRTGRREVDDGQVVEYAGRSLVARPDGGIRAALDRRPDDLVVELDPETVAAQREFVGIYDEPNA